MPHADNTRKVPFVNQSFHLFDFHQAILPLKQNGFFFNTQPAFCVSYFLYLFGLFGPYCTYFDVDYSGIVKRPVIEPLWSVSFVTKFIEIQTVYYIRNCHRME